MLKITVDGALRAKLESTLQPVELCDASGRVLGSFFPNPDPALFDGLEPTISEEEIQRRRQSKGKTYTTAEVLAYLGRL